MREALIIEVDGLRLHGTRHIGPVAGERGILFFNSGAQPRSGRGDLNVHLADELANQGWPCFRFDLPGLGDSEGELPGQYLELYRYIQQGGHASVAKALAKALCESNGLSELALFGVCGGAITAVFAAAWSQNLATSGLILLDLPFCLSRGMAAAGTQGPSKSFRRRAVELARESKARAHDWVIESRWEPYVSAFYRRLMQWRGRGISRGLPADANLKLLEALDSVLARGTPVLLITAQPAKGSAPGFDYASYVQQPRAGDLEEVQIQGTTHSFVENEGPSAVLRAITKWLGRLDDGPSTNGEFGATPEPGLVAEAES